MRRIAFEPISLSVDFGEKSSVSCCRLSGLMYALSVSRPVVEGANEEIRRLWETAGKLMRAGKPKVARCQWRLKAEGQ